MSNQNIDKINSEIKATIGVSKISGVGVIALTDILKGQKVYADRMPQVLEFRYSALHQLFPYVKKVVLDRWPNIINGGKVILHDIHLLSLMNHSSDPNYDPIKDEALRDIKIGEEITENYKSMPNYEKIWPDIENWT